MNTVIPYQPLANTVLALHFLVVLFVVGGLLVIVAGNLLCWRWVNNFWLRASHMTAIAVVAMQAWLGVDCPLTVLEAWLRGKAGFAPYRETFVEHWLGQWLYYDAPWWVFVAAYSLLGLLVAAAWWRFPPERRRSGRRSVGPGNPA